MELTALDLTGVYSMDYLETLFLIGLDVMPPQPSVHLSSPLFKICNLLIINDFKIPRFLAELLGHLVLYLFWNGLLFAELTQHYTLRALCVLHPARRI